MEHPKHHEFIQPIREIVHGLGNFVMNRILPTDVISDLFNGASQEVPAETYTQLTIPDIQGRDL